MSIGGQYRVTAIVQARMSSTRLFGKVLLPLGGDTALGWCIRRLRMAKGVDAVMVATTENEADNCLADWCRERKVSCYRGSESDVLLRVLEAARHAEADYIVDVTSDCPLVDPGIVSWLIRFMEDNGGINYAANDVINRSWCDGVDVQVYSIQALESVSDLIPAGHKHREHAGWNIGIRPEHFNCFQLVAPEACNWPELSASLDTLEDLRVIDAVIAEMALCGKGDRFTVADVVTMLRDKPHLITNAAVPRKWRAVTEEYRRGHE